jgi:hypothetical protein
VAFGVFGVDLGVLGLADGVDCGVLGLVDGINFGVLGVASPVDLTLGLGRIGSEKKRAGTGFTNVVDQKTAKKDDTNMGTCAKAKIKNSAAILNLQNP